MSKRLSNETDFQNKFTDDLVETLQEPPGMEEYHHDGEFYIASAGSEVY
jgi:hypothetical protein